MWLRLRLPTSPWNATEIRQTVSGIVGIVVVYSLAQDPWLTDRVPPLPVVLAGLTSLLLVVDRTPVLAFAWWAFGALSVTWSLAPGDTLVFGLWGIVFLGAFASGMWRTGFWILTALLVVHHAQLALSLNLFGLEAFVSGSVHYVAGAQALIAMTLLVYLFESDHLWVRLGAFVIGSAGMYIALISGARAVYVPTIIIVVLIVMVARRQTIGWPRILAVAAMVALFIGAADWSLTPTSLDTATARSPLETALGTKATVEATVASAREQGAFAGRLRFWRQAVDVGLSHPGGTGAGSFDDVIHAFQRYPMAWSSSAHNVFLETFADGGIVWVAILTTLIFTALWFAWRSRRWAYALAAGGIWFTLAVDVTASNAYVMSLAFCTLGAAVSTANSFRPVQVHRWITFPLKANTAIGLVVCACMGGWIAWWFTPCDGIECALSRHGGLESEVVPHLDGLDSNQARETLAELRSLYPQSLWVLGLEKQRASSKSERLHVAREIAQRFPYQHPENFLTWAETARAAGETEEAEHALLRGLAIFPPNEYPFGEARMSSTRYEAWIEAAHALLAELQSSSVQ